MMWTLAPLKRGLRATSPGLVPIKGSVSQVEADGLWPAFSASGQDVWVTDAHAPFTGPGLVLSAVGARCGKVFLAAGRWGVVANTSVLLPQQGYDPRFLWYVTNREDFWERGGTAQPYVLVQATLNKVVPTPPLDAQRRIADFLDDQVALLDRAVDLRQRQVALFSERFVADLATIYDLGREDRRSKRLQDMLAQSPGYGVLVPVFVGEGVPFIRVTDLPSVDQGLVPVARISAAQSAEYRRTIVDGGDVLTSVVGTLGATAIVPMEVSGANVARAVCRLRPGPGVPSWFLRGWLATPQFLSLAHRATGSGTAQATLNMGDIAKFPVAVPMAGGLDVIAKEVQGLFAEEKRHSALLDCGRDLLHERRQALITAAVTGQFDVATARSVA